MPATLRREDLHAPALSALPGCTLVPGSSATLRFEAGGTSTQMACAPQVMQQAGAFMSSLTGASSCRVEAGEPQLRGADGALAVSLARE